MKSSAINPFVIGKYVSDVYFCDRVKETNEVIKHVENGRNLTLISDRRLGKSGLISHVFAQKEIKDRYFCVNVDLYATSNLAELVCLFGECVYHSIQQQNLSWRDKFFQIISSLRVGFKLDPISGAPSFDIGIGDITAPTMTLEQIFTYLEAADKPCIVAFDEFQQIASYPEKNIEALLRTHIQRCKRTQFIFAGSRKHMMAQMFLSPSKPFYQSTINMGLEPIPRDTYIDFAKQMFVVNQKTISSDAIGFVYDRCRGITWYLQVLMNEMYALTPIGGQCGNDEFEQALTNVIQVQEPFYREMMVALPSKQKSLLYAIAKEHQVTNITSSAFIQKYKLASSSSVQAALKGLKEKDIVSQQNTAWQIYDIFFEQYLTMNKI